MFSSSKSTFDPDRDIPSLKGKVVVVTGGNNGLGKETVYRIAKHDPETLYLCSRNAERGEEAVKEIKAQVPGANIKLLEVDLSSFESVSAAASKFQSETDRLDVLINNAGIMAVPAGKTKDGYEIQFGTNHIGHALLTKLLMPTLLKTAEKPDADVRVVNLSSRAHERCPEPGINFDDLTMPSASVWARYSQSKLANILYTKQLAKHYPQITTVSLHPGVIRTNLFAHIVPHNGILGGLISIFGGVFFTSVPEGTKNQLWAATVQKDKLVNGDYYVPVGVHYDGSAYAQDQKMAEKLWDWTEEEFKKHGY